MILIKKQSDFVRRSSPFCGEFFQILSGEEYQPDLVVFPDIRPTEPHYHNNFEEIYFVLDGEIEVETYDPSEKSKKLTILTTNELLVIGLGVHHRISKTSEANRLCVISKPCYNRDDIHASKYI